MGVADLVATGYITGAQHLGTPVRDMDGTLKFHGDLGSEKAFSMRNNGRRVVFVKQRNLVVELYGEGETAAKPGAIDHTTLDVMDVERTFELVDILGYGILDTEIQFLPFWKHDVKFFTIMGPNEGKVELSQRMQ